MSRKSYRMAEKARRPDHLGGASGGPDEDGARHRQIRRELGKHFARQQGMQRRVSHSTTP
eukprot:7322268-Pyramimonas_sp.AAC.1